jgi:hypothetical protein
LIYLLVLLKIKAQNEPSLVVVCRGLHMFLQDCASRRFFSPPFLLLIFSTLHYLY